MIPFLASLRNLGAEVTFLPCLSVPLLRKFVQAAIENRYDTRRRAFNIFSQWFCQYVGTHRSQQSQTKSVSGYQSSQKLVHEVRRFGVCMGTWPMTIFVSLLFCFLFTHLTFSTCYLVASFLIISNFDHTVGCEKIGRAHV